VLAPDEAFVAKVFKGRPSMSTRTGVLYNLFNVLTEEGIITYTDIANITGCWSS
jgi:hypothetical protein